LGGGNTDTVLSSVRNEQTGRACERDRERSEPSCGDTGAGIPSPIAGLGMPFFLMCGQGGSRIALNTTGRTGIRCARDPSFPERCGRQSVSALCSLPQLLTLFLWSFSCCSRTGGL